MFQGQLLSWILNPRLKLYHRQNNNNHISENHILIKKKRKETVVRGYVYVQIILRVSFGEVPESVCTKFLMPYKYVGYTPDQYVDDHWFSAAGNHLKNNHGIETIGYLTTNSFILKRCKRKLSDCLLYDMFFIKRNKPCLNKHSDSICTNLFVY